MRALRIVVAGALAAAVFAAAPDAHALFTCSIVTTSGVAFGAYDPLSSTALDTAGSISYRCDLLTIAPVTMTLSTGSALTFTPRTLRAGASTLQYNLYLDAARTLVWGNGLSGTSNYGPVSSVLGSNVTVPVYGRIPARQNVRAGSYSDTLVVTVIF